MSNQGDENRKSINLLQYWQVIVAVVLIIASFVTVQNRQANADDRIDKVEKKQASADTANTQILVQLSAIQSDLSWIREKFKTIK